MYVQWFYFYSETAMHTMDISSGKSMASQGSCIVDRYSDKSPAGTVQSRGLCVIVSLVYKRTALRPRVTAKIPGSLQSCTDTVYGTLTQNGVE